MMTKKMSNEVTSMTDKKLIQPTDGTVEQTLNRSFGAIEDEDCCSLRHIGSDEISKPVLNLKILVEMLIKSNVCNGLVYIKKCFVQFLKDM